MPKYLKRRRARRNPKSVRSKLFRKPKNRYRPHIPRTLQIATRRNPNQILRFVINQSYIYDGTVTGNGDTAFLCFRANSIYNSQIPVSTTAGEWTSQDPTKYSNKSSDLITQSADGYDDWKNRYNHFSVLGSKIQTTIEPMSTGTPCIHFHHLSGTQGAIQAGVKSSTINQLPYTYRTSVNATIQGGGATGGGSRMYQSYSTKKFEGVKDVRDNSNLRGSFGNISGGPALPAEQSFFYVGLSAVDPLTTTSNPKAIVRVKVEYIVMLKEPTETNQVQVTATANAPEAFGPDEL